MKFQKEMPVRWFAFLIVIVAVMAFSAFYYEEGMSKSSNFRLKGVPNQELLLLDKEKTYTLILFAGQSNMSGKVKKKAVIKKLSLPKDSYYFNLRGVEEAVGPDFRMAHEMLNAYPGRHFIFVKLAVPGSSMENWTDLYYDPLRDALLKITSDLNVTFGAFVWMQGETDCRREDLAHNYERALKRFIDGLIHDLRIDDLPLIIGRVNPPEQLYWYAEVVRQAQKNIVTHYKDACLVDTNKLTKLEDGLHYDGRGTDMLGMRFFFAYQVLHAGGRSDVNASWCDGVAE